MYITSSTFQPILASLFLKHLFTIDGIRSFQKFPLLDTFVCQLLLRAFLNNLITVACLSEFVWPDVTTWDVRRKNVPGDNLCGRARLNTTVSHFTYSTISTCLMGTWLSGERRMWPRWLHAVLFIRFIFTMHIKNVFFFYHEEQSQGENI